MEQRNREKDRIMHELTECQRRVNELEQGEMAEQQQALCDAKALFEGLFELSPDALILVDRQGRIARMNTEAERLFGYGRGDLVGKDHDVLVPQALAGKHESQMRAYMEHPRMRVMGTGLELRGRRRDGTEFAADIDLGPLEIAKELFVLAVVRDATRRKKLEDNLLESEKRYRDLVELSPDTIAIISEGKVVFVNAAGPKLLGLEAVDDVIGRPLLDFLHPEYQQTARERIRQTIEEGTMAPLVRATLLKADGTAVYVDAISMPYAHGGKPATLSIIRDVTERKRLEEELNNYRSRLETVVAQRTFEFAQANEELARKIDEHRRSEEGLALRAAILDNAREAVFLINPEGNFVYANEAAVRMYGYSRDEFIAMTLHQLVRPEEAPAIDERLQNALRTGKTEVETLHVRKDKSLMPVEVRHSLLKTLHGQFIVTVTSDTTNRFRLRSLLEQMPAALWATDGQLRLTAATGAGIETLGLKPDAGIGMTLAEYLERNGLDGDALAAHQDALTGTAVGFRLVCKKSGRTFRGQAAPLRNVRGEISGTLGTAMDISAAAPAAK